MNSFLLKLTLAALFVSSALPAPVAGLEVTGNDILDVYEISGAVLIDSDFAESRSAATCGNCHWRILRTCASGPLEDRRNCLGIPCVRAEDIAEVWRADAAAPPPVGDPLWTYRGLVCLVDPPVSLAAVSLQIRDLAIRSIPPLHPTSQPSAITLTGLPTVFRTAQPAQLNTVPATVSGITVTIHAVPTWTWDFGHGDLFTTTDPGSPWPTGRIRHTYPRRGIYRVRVTANWRAVYSVRGISDLPVDGALAQSAWFDLRVREARRFLRKPQGA